MLNRGLNVSDNFVAIFYTLLDEIEIKQIATLGKIKKKDFVAENEASPSECTDFYLNLSYYILPFKIEVDMREIVARVLEKANGWRRYFCCHKLDLLQKASKSYELQ